MKDTLVSFRTGSLAQEKGFNKVICRHSWINSEGNWIPHAKRKSLNWKGIILRPTQNLLLKWLREKHKIHVEIRTYSISKPEEFSYVVNILRKSYSEWIRIDSFLNYEEALEAGLYEALLLI